jgi:hypothetical protein
MRICKLAGDDLFGQRKDFALLLVSQFENMKMMKRLLGLFSISIVLGFFLMAPLAVISQRMQWGLFTGWGLAHGGFIFAWPVLTLVSFLVLALFWGRSNKSS